MTDPNGRLKETAALALEQALAGVYGAAARELAERIAWSGDATVLPRWQAEIAAVIAKSTKRTAAKASAALWADFEASGEAPDELMHRYLEVAAEGHATGWVAATNAALSVATSDTVKDVLARRVAAAGADAMDATQQAASFGADEAAKHSGRTVLKTWHLGGAKQHRSSHASQAGKTLEFGQTFPNGQKFPHGPGPSGESADCHCYLVYSTRDDEED